MSSSTLENLQKPLSLAFDKDAALAATLYVIGQFEFVKPTAVSPILYLADKLY